MLDVASYLKLLNEVGQRAAEVPGAIAALAEAARAHGVPMLSHDDVSPAMRSFFRDLGAHIAEFPMNRDTLNAAADAGDFIVLGAPNVVRGGSHNGAIGAEEAIRDGKSSVLASDYYYPAQLAAIRTLDAKGTLALDRGWPMISSAAAEAAGLGDRGVIAVGQRADLVILPEGAFRPAATISGGRVVFRSH